MGWLKKLKSDSMTTQTTILAIEKTQGKLTWSSTDDQLHFDILILYVIVQFLSSGGGQDVHQEKGLKHTTIKWPTSLTNFDWKSCSSGFLDIC